MDLLTRKINVATLKLHLLKKVSLKYKYSMIVIFEYLHPNLQQIHLQASYNYERNFTSYIIFSKLFHSCYIPTIKMQNFIEF